LGTTHAIAWNGITSRLLKSIGIVEGSSKCEKFKSNKHLGIIVDSIINIDAIAFTEHRLLGLVEGDSTVES